MSSSPSSHNVVPAQLSFLTIYNPSFGDTDDTAYEQILCYCERKDVKGSQAKQERAKDGKPGKEEESGKNERLRNVGLARGMVEFAK